MQVRGAVRVPGRVQHAADGGAAARPLRGAQEAVNGVQLVLLVRNIGECRIVVLVCCFLRRGSRFGRMMPATISVDRVIAIAISTASFVVDVC